MKDHRVAICSKCNSVDMVKFGKFGDKQKFRCNKCKYVTCYPDLRDIRKMLVVDRKINE